MSAASDSLLLKARLIATGLSIAPGMRERLRVAGTPDLSVDLVLPSGVPASVPMLAGDGSSAAYHLVDDADQAYVEQDGHRTAVTATPLPRFYEHRTSQGTSMHTIAERRGRVLLVTPAGRCGFSVAGSPCPFCIEGARSAGATEASITPSDVVEVVLAARREAAIDVVLFNTDAFDGDDGGISFLAPFVQAVRRHVHTLIAAQLHPPRTAAWVDRTYALGIDAVSYSLEIFDPDLFGRLCVGRARYIRRERYLEMLARATAIFPRGAVWSELVLGIEPPESTRAGIDALARLGAVPVLAIPRAQTGAVPHPPSDGILPLVTQLHAATDANRVPVTWIRDLGSGITPHEAQRANATSSGGLGALLARLVPHLAVRSARAISRIRRRLRVRTPRAASDH